MEGMKVIIWGNWISLPDSITAKQRRDKNFNALEKSQDYPPKTLH
jgi:hypothetical protein